MLRSSHYLSSLVCFCYLTILCNELLDRNVKESKLYKKQYYCICFSVIERETLILSHTVGIQQIHIYIFYTSL